MSNSLNVPRLLLFKRGRRRYKKKISIANSSYKTGMTYHWRALPRMYAALQNYKAGMTYHWRALPGMYAALQKIKRGRVLCRAIIATDIRTSRACAVKTSKPRGPAREDLRQNLLWNWREKTYFTLAIRGLCSTSGSILTVLCSSTRVGTGGHNILVSFWQETTPRWDIFNDFGTFTSL